MKKWPLKYQSAKIPKNGEPGSFWEDRGDRHHCGVDLYAPESSEVVSIEDGEVVEVEEMTSPEIVPHWNTTFHIIVRNDSGMFCKYGEVSENLVNKGDIIISGQLIGYVGKVLNQEKIDHSSPAYIQNLKARHPSMLHLELWKNNPITVHRQYLGGNWFAEEKPENLVDPTEYLRSIQDKM
ncbi:Peptidase M23 [Methanosalsum zhilinae DSM 4017]|uniref:Peptidase M23 n=1 Tax=Methanosalsum zhilinae (strain DSM 4017 / NBRC 107636 / OCM 62 / WeN5) TaxID=679901 RepID=F7XP47_METZD|nr:M23 family metallopeptidase [Methanosalsum zhilinae]AEH61339.1 Peptidase M23 [Methanosalsum zhilinae DSM 4017]